MKASNPCTEPPGSTKMTKHDIIGIELAMIGNFMLSIWGIESMKLNGLPFTTDMIATVWRAVVG